MNLSVYNTPAQMSNIINLYIYWRCLLCSNCHSTAHITIFFSFASNCVCNAPYIFQSHNKKNMTYMIRRHNIHISLLQVPQWHWFFNFSLFELSYYMPTSICHVGTYGKRRYAWIAPLKAMMKTRICNKIIIFSKESGISKYLVTLYVTDSSASILQGLVANGWCFGPKG